MATLRARLVVLLPRKKLIRDSWKDAIQFGIDFPQDEEYLELCRQFERAFSHRTSASRKRKPKYRGQNVHALRLKRYATR